jgi:hypothetical protein
MELVLEVDLSGHREPEEVKSFVYTHLEGDPDRMDSLLEQSFHVEQKRQKRQQLQRFVPVSVWSPD